MGVDMPLCSRRAWTTFQGPVDPSRLPTCPPQVATTTASSFHAFNPDTQAGRRRVFIMTTIQTQRPTLLYVSQFYPDKTRTTVPVLSRHSQAVAGADWAPSLMASLVEHQIVVQPPPDDPIAAVRGGSVDLVLLVPPNYQ